MKLLLPLVLVTGCSAAKPYGESACNKLGFTSPPVEQPASAQVVEQAPTSSGDMRVDSIALKVRTKRKELDAKEAELSTREAKLKTDIATFEAARAAATQKSLAGTLPAPVRAGVQAVQTTIALMPPKSAAKVIEAMDDREAAKMVMSLPPQTAAEVFQAMAPPRAAKISMLMRDQR